MIKSLKDLLDKFSRFTNSLVYDGGICKRLKELEIKVDFEIKQNEENNKILLQQSKMAAMGEMLENIAHLLIAFLEIYCCAIRIGMSHFVLS